MSSRSLVPVLATVSLLAGCGGGGGGGGGGHMAFFVESNLVANSAGAAANVDPLLVNGWGISATQAGAIWVSDNVTGKSTTYNGSGVNQNIVVNVPGHGVANGPVTGQVANTTSDFVVGGFPAKFIFDTSDGVISAWYSGASAIVMADRSGSGAGYTGLAMASNAGANFLFAANFNAGTIDIFDHNFAFVKSVSDAAIPAGYAPYAVTAAGNKLYVAYAKENPANHFAVPGAGFGFVDVFNTDGTVATSKFISQGALNTPWGMALAPAGFGSFGGDLLVGNLGDGTIHAFDPNSGALKGTLSDSTGKPIVIDGLWGLMFGVGGLGGSPGTLYFTAGPGFYTSGLFGSLTPG